MTAPDTPGTDVARRGALTNLIETYREDFAAVVPSHVSADAFVQLAIAYVRQNQFLRRAAQENPASLIIALRECAALGHVPQKGIFALTPRNVYNKEAKRKVWTVVGVEEVRGTIERMYRSGGVMDVRAVCIRENDQARWNPGTMQVPYHEYDEFADPAARGPLKAVYAVAHLVTGGTAVAFLNRHQVQKYREISNTGDNFWGPPWPAEGPWTEKMWEKTALHRLERDVPTSAAYREAVARATAAGEGRFPGVPPRPPVAPGMAGPEAEPVDAEIVDEAPAQRADGASTDDPWSDVDVAQPGSGS